MGDEMVSVWGFYREVVVVIALGVTRSEGEVDRVGSVGREKIMVWMGMGMCGSDR